MEKETKSVSNTPEKETIVSDDPKQEKETVAYETHRKLLSQRKSDQDKLRQAQEIIEKFEAEKRNVEELKLQEQGEFKKLLTLRDDELNKTREERDRFQTEIQDTWKYQAFYKKLGGKLENSAYLTFVDKDAIILNPETGEIDEQSVEAVVNDFRQKHGRLIVQNNTSKLPNQPSSFGLKPKSIGNMNNEEKINKLGEALGNVFRH